MNTQKIQASKNVKGFTLVELIVVITILAILGTIAFLSLQGQSAAARDSKRKTDLSSLSSKVTIAQANGTSVAATITTAVAQTVTGVGISLGGTATPASYVAGTPNYTALGVSATDFKDPKGSDYAIGGSTLAGGVFQLAATLEADNAGNTTPNAITVGTYSPRTATTTVVSPAAAPTISGNNLIYTISSNSDIGKLKTNDVVAVTNTTTCGATKVLSVSSDLGTLTIACTTTPTVPAIGTITLGTDAATNVEMGGLIADKGADKTKVVVNAGTTYLPY